jgi:hypothetical protein
MPRRFNPEAQLPIEVELQREKASALRRVGHKLEQLIAELAQLEKEIASASGAERAKRLTRHAALLREAEDQRWKMIVQREAMGLSRHEEVDRHYPLPRPIQE